MASFSCLCLVRASKDQTNGRDGTGIRHDVCTFQRKMFLFRFSWTEYQDFEQFCHYFTISTDFKGNELNNILQRRDYCCHGSQSIQPYTAAMTVCSVYLLAFFTISLHSSRSAVVNLTARWFFFFFLKEAVNRFHWASLSDLASILGVRFWWWMEFKGVPSIKMFLKKRRLNWRSHCMNRWTTEQNSIANSHVLIMLVKEPIRLVSRCGPLNNEYTSRNMPQFQSFATISTSLLSDVFSTTSSFWIIDTNPETGLSFWGS